MGFKNIREYFLSGYSAGKQAGNEADFIWAGWDAGRHYLCPTRPIAIPNQITGPKWSNNLNFYT